MPIFRRDKLDAFLEIYDGSLSAWGIDHWYGNVFRADEFARFAIIDKVRVRNPYDKEKGGRETEMLQPTPQRSAAWEALRKKRGLVEFPHRVFAAGKLVALADQRRMAGIRFIDRPFLRRIPGYAKLRAAASACAGRRAICCAAAQSRLHGQEWTRPSG